MERDLKLSREDHSACRETITRMERGSAIMIDDALARERMDGLTINALKKEIDELRLGLREARDLAEKAAAQYNALLLNDPVLRCAFCGEEYPSGTLATKSAALTAHIAVCPEHPMRAVEEERDGLRDEVIDYLRDITRLFDCLSEGVGLWQGDDRAPWRQRANALMLELSTTSDLLTDSGPAGLALAPDDGGSRTSKDPGSGGSTTQSGGGDGAAGAGPAQRTAGDDGPLGASGHEPGRRRSLTDATKVGLVERTAQELLNAVRRYGEALDYPSVQRGCALVQQALALPPDPTAEDMRQACLRVCHERANRWQKAAITSIVLSSSQRHSARATAATVCATAIEQIRLPATEEETP